MQNQTVHILRQLGAGKMSATAYDTAWVARLGDIDFELSNRALEWLSENQLSDGSWGTSFPFYYHDRVICTLAAMLALTQRGRRAHDRQQIERGLLALEKITAGATKGLMADLNGATVGFEMIIPTLVAEAEERGIIKQQGETILGQLGRQRQVKMEKLGDRKISRHLTPAHSAEMAGRENISILDVDNLQEANGSIGNSPSATAFFALFVRRADEKALAYLRNSVFEDGGAPTLTPIELFERIWAMWNLSLTGLEKRSEEASSLYAANLNYIAENWKPGYGLGFSASFSIPDSDDTAIAFELLQRNGMKSELAALLRYEEDEWFRCFQFEANPSVDVNVHILRSLKTAGYPKSHPTIQKLLSFIRSRQKQHGYWMDKWHVSPYYTTSHVVICCKEYDDALCEESIQWILNSQKPNGAWGFYGISTIEETAYCIQALRDWKKSGKQIPSERYLLAKKWLERNANQPCPPMWIDKSLYRPDLIVQSSIQSALDPAEEN